MKKYILPALGGILILFVLIYVAERLSQRWEQRPPTPRAIEIPASPRWTPSAEDWGKG